MYPPPPAKPSPGRRSGVAPPIPGRLPLPPPARHRIQPSRLFRTCLPPAKYNRPTCPACGCFFSHLPPPLWPLWFCKAPPPLPIPATPLFTFSPLFIAPARLFATAHTCQSLTAAPAHPSIHVPFKTKRPTLPAPPSPCPLHGFHTTNCYPCFYTTLPDFLTVSEQPFATFGSEAPCLPDLARVLRCNLPPLVLQAAPDHTTSSLRRVPCCFPLSSTPPYLPSLVKHLFGGSAAPGRQPIYNIPLNPIKSQHITTKSALNQIPINHQ